ncbi:hypothetical protein D3C85_1353990 [compost metagenome]
MPHQHIPELRQFVNAGLAQESSCTCDARIIFDLEHRAADLVVGHQIRLQLLGIGDHGSEFIHWKQLLVLTHPVLTEEHLSFGIFQLDQDRHHYEQRQQYEKAKSGEKNVDNPLHHQIGIHFFASFFGM